MTFFLSIFGFIAVVISATGKLSIMLTSVLERTYTHPFRLLNFSLSMLSATHKNIPWCSA